MKRLKFFAVTALLLASPAAMAANEVANQDKPYFVTSQSRKISAQVEAIDHKSRLVTLRRPQGDTVTFTASEEARNLDQVSVGDIVTAEYVETVSIEVMANEGTEPGTGELAAVARTEKGEMPGFVAMDTQVVTATVEEIDLEANTYKLKGPDGTVKEYVARNPENLKKAAVGDLVVITFTEAMAISVEVGPES